MIVPWESRCGTKRSVVRLALLIAALVIDGGGAALAAQRRPTVPVTIGGEEPSEGCAGTSRVSLPSGGRLNLRSGPGPGYRIVAHLSAGQSVSVCQRDASGWVGVVVNLRGAGRRDCRLSDAGPRRTPYRGPCASGWVMEKYLRLQAD
jgi:hypothetical protein